MESLWGEVFQNGPGAHPASRTHPHLAPKLKKEQSYTSTPTSGPSWLVLGCTFKFYCIVCMFHT